MSIKTTKRLALGVIAALVFAPFAAIAPASAAGLTDATESTFVVAGTTTAVTANAGAAAEATSAGADTIYVRSTAASNTFKFGIASAANGDNPILYMASGTAEPTNDAGTIALTKGADVTGLTATATTLTTTAGADAAAEAITLTIAGNATAFSNFTFTTGALPAGTYSIFLSDTANLTTNAKNYKIATITSQGVGEPVTASYSAVGFTQVGSPADVNSTISLKDSSGRSTFLVGDETIVNSATPVTNANAPAVQGLDASGTTTAASTPTLTAGVFAGYTVIIEAGGTAPTKGVLYTNTSTITKGVTAFGSASATYRNIDTTAGIAGGSITFTDATSKAVVSTISAAASQQTTAADYVITVKDAAGALVKGVTPVATATSGTVSVAVGATGDAGTNSAFRFTAPATAGTSTVTFALSTGATSLSTSVVVTTTTYGATAAVAASAVKSVVALNGAGVVMTSTAPTTNAWSAARNVSGFTVTLGGLDASKTAKVTLTSTATGGTINGVAAASSPIYPVATAAGEIVLTLAVTSAAATNTLVVAVDANNAADVTVLTITFNDATNTITTDPKSGTLNMSTPSATKVITAAGTDQFKNPITGGSFKITNTVVPAGATAATAVTVNASATGTATLNAVLGATLGTYTFTVDLISVNAAVLATSTINYSVTTTGIAGTLTLTDSDTVDAAEGITQADNKSTRSVVIAPAALTANALIATDNIVSFTVVTATPAGLAFTATATNGARLFTTSPNTAVIKVGAASVTGTAGTTTVFAVPTKVGDSVITVTSGGLTKVFTLTGKLNATPKAQLITLTPGTNTNGRAAYTVRTTDTFGNPVAANVDITVTGTGFFSSGFKGITVPTGTAGTNGFEILSPLGGANTLSATIATASFQAITATEATTQTVTASVQTATATVTVAAAAPEIVYAEPTLSFVKDGGRIILSGTAVDGEGDIIIYTKRVGTTAWKERAKTLEVAAPGDYNGSIKALKNNVVIRVKQEGTGLFSNQIIVLK